MNVPQICNFINKYENNFDSRKEKRKKQKTQKTMKGKHFCTI